MVKLKYRFTTWANCQYYHAFVNGKKLAINVIKGPKDYLGNREIEIQAQSEEIDHILCEIFPTHSIHGIIHCTDMKDCKETLKKVAEKAA